MVIPAVVFIVLFGGIFAAYWTFVVRREEAAVGAVRKRLRSVRDIRGAARSGSLVADVRANSSIGFLDEFLGRRKSWFASLDTLIEQSGANVTVGSVLLGSAVLSLLA